MVIHKRVPVGQKNTSKFIKAKSELKTHLDLIKPNSASKQRLQNSIRDIQNQLNQHKLGSINATGGAQIADLSTAGLFMTDLRKSPLSKSPTLSPLAKRHQSLAPINLTQTLVIPGTSALSQQSEVGENQDFLASMARNITMIQSPTHRKTSLRQHHNQVQQLSKKMNNYDQGNLPAVSQMSCGTMSPRVIRQHRRNTSIDQYQASRQKQRYHPITSASPTSLPRHNSSTQLLVEDDSPASVNNTVMCSQDRVVDWKRKQTLRAVQKIVKQREKEAENSHISDEPDIIQEKKLEQLSIKEPVTEVVIRQQSSLTFGPAPEKVVQLPPLRGAVQSPMRHQLPWTKKDVQAFYKNFEMVVEPPSASVIRNANVTFIQVEQQVKTEPVSVAVSVTDNDAEFARETEYAVSRNQFLTPMGTYQPKKSLDRTMQGPKKSSITDQSTGSRSQIKKSVTIEENATHQSPFNRSNQKSQKRTPAPSDKMESQINKSIYKKVVKSQKEVQKEKKWKETSRELKSQLLEKRVQEAAQEDEYSCHSMFSDHPSVDQDRTRSQFHKLKRKVATMVNTQQPSQRSSSYDDESQNSNEEEDNEGQDQQDSLEAETKRLKEEAEKANAASNVKKDQFKRELATKDAEQQDFIQLCGKDLIEKMQKALHKIAMGSKKINKTGEDNNLSVDESSATSDMINTRDRNLIVKKDLKKNLMLESGNTSIFNEEVNKNFFSDKKTKAALKFSRMGKQQMAFYKLCKKYVYLKDTDSGKNDPRIKFFEACVKENELVLPILSKIIDNSLTLKNYKLNMGLCRAIQQFCTLNPHGLHRLFLLDNGIEASELNEVLEGLSHQSYFKSLAVQDNTLDDKSVVLIGQLLKKKMPENLDTLRLSHLKINWKTTQNLIEMLARQRCFLRKLELVKVNLNEFSVRSLGEVIKQLRTVVYLDLSWNAITPQNMLPLLEILSKNRRLQYLNLSWNCISEELDSKEHQKYILMLLGRLIKFNKKFLHFDLTGTGLTKFIVHSLGHQLKRSRSLQAIHLSCNPGLVAEEQEYLRNRITARPNEDMERFKRIKLVVDNCNKNRKGQMIDGLYAKQCKIVEQKPDIFQPIGISDRFVLQRMLGFKQMIPGSGQWYESSNFNVPNSTHYKHQCWMCEGHVFAIIFWSRKNAFRLGPLFTSNQGNGPQAELIMSEIDKAPAGHLEEVTRIKTVEPDGSETIDYKREVGPGIGFVDGHLPYEDLDDGVPYLTGSFTGWRYRKMLRVSDMCKEMVSDYVDPFQRCKDLGKIRKKVTSYEKCSKQEQKNYQEELLQETINYTYKWEGHFKKNIKYKKPYIVNGYELNDWFQDEFEQHTAKEQHRNAWKKSVHEKILSKPALGASRNNQQNPTEAHKPVLLLESDLELPPDIDELSSDDREEAYSRTTKKKEYIQGVKDRAEKVRKRIQRKEAGEDEVTSSDSSVDDQMILKNKDIIEEAEKLYALPLFIKPGKHQYLVKLRDSSERNQRKVLRKVGQSKQFKEDVKTPLKPELFFYEMQAIGREEEVPEFAKPMLTTTVERQFKRNKSVFRMWIKDDPTQFNELAKTDFQYWKIGPKMIKSEEDCANVLAIIMKNYEKLKHIFVYLSSKSSYPALTQMDYAAFVLKSKINDKNVNLAAVDRVFIATNVTPRGAPEVPGNPGNALCRFQFMEAVVRLGNEKYKSPGLVKTFAEGTQRVLDECIFKYYEPEPWQSWREEELWSLDVDDLYGSNVENLQAIYKTYFTQIKKYMDLKDCYQMCMEDCDLGIKENDICLCFGMSKMTVKDECYPVGTNYVTLKFVEFLEFIGRLSALKYKNQPDMSLVQKIEFMMDSIFEHFNMQRNDIEIEVEEISESDEDY